MEPDGLVVHEIREADLKSVFEGEASGFTPWLAREDNLARLGTALGLSLAPVETEVSTGTFRVDLVARNTADDTTVIVENQFSRSDHDHLGKALTYLAASRTTATSVVWLAERFADERRAVLEWLNDNTGEETGFWAVVLKVLRIGDSAPGLRFDVVVAPNRMVKATRTATKSYDPSVTETRAQYWEIFSQKLAAAPGGMRPVTRYGGRSGHMQVFPHEGFAQLAPWAHCLAYITVPVARSHTTGVWPRPTPDPAQPPGFADRVERMQAAWRRHMESEALDEQVPTSFATAEEMRAAVEAHVDRVLSCLRVIEAEFAAEAASGEQGAATPV